MSEELDAFNKSLRLKFDRMTMDQQMGQFGMMPNQDLSAPTNGLLQAAKRKNSNVLGQNMFGFQPPKIGGFK